MLSTLVHISYLVPMGLVALVAAWWALPWWGLAVLSGFALVVWDWLWGLAHLRSSSTSWLALLVGSAGLVASAYLARELGLGLDGFLASRADAPRHADWLYWLPSVGLGLVVYGGILRLLQAHARR